MKLELKWKASPKSWVVGPPRQEHLVEVSCSEVGEQEAPGEVRVEGGGVAPRTISLVARTDDDRTRYVATVPLAVGSWWPQTHRFSVDGAPPRALHLVPRRSQYLSYLLLILLAALLTWATQVLRRGQELSVFAEIGFWAGLFGAQLGGGFGLSLLSRKIKEQLHREESQELPLLGVGRSVVATTWFVGLVGGLGYLALWAYAQGAMVAVCNPTERSETVTIGEDDSEIEGLELNVLHHSRAAVEQAAPSMWREGARLELREDEGASCPPPRFGRIEPPRLQVGCRPRVVHGIVPGQLREEGSAGVRACGEQVCLELSEQCEEPDAPAAVLGGAALCEARACQPHQARLSVGTPRLQALLGEEQTLLPPCARRRRLSVASHEEELTLRFGYEDGDPRPTEVAVEMLVPSGPAQTVATPCPRGRQDCALELKPAGSNVWRTIPCASGVPGHDFALVPVVAVSESAPRPLRRMEVHGDGWSSQIESPDGRLRHTEWVCAAATESLPCGADTAPASVQRPISITFEFGTVDATVTVPGRMMPTQPVQVELPEGQGRAILACEVPQALRDRPWTIEPLRLPEGIAADVVAVRHGGDEASEPSRAWTSTWSVASAPQPRGWRCRPADLEEEASVVTLGLADDSTRTGSLDHGQLTLDPIEIIEEPVTGPRRRACCLKQGTLERISCPGGLSSCTEWGKPDRLSRYAAHPEERRKCSAYWECP